MRQSPAGGDVDGGPHGDAADYATKLEEATRGLLALNMVVLEDSAKRVGLSPLRALQALHRRGPSLVTEMGNDLDLAPSASRLSDRLAEAGLITRTVAPHNRRATLLELTPEGYAVLDRLRTHRADRFHAVADQMAPDDREGLLRGAAAFTAIQHQMTGPHPPGPARDPPD